MGKSGKMGHQKVAHILKQDCICGSAMEIHLRPRVPGSNRLKPWWSCNSCGEYIRMKGK